MVVGLAEMMAACAAEQLQGIDELRRAHLMDAEVAGQRFTDVVMRGLRLEIAAAMRIAEHAAGRLISLAEALVHRYPTAMRSLERARITERHAEILVDGLDELEPGLRAGLFDRALALAETEPVGEFRRSLRRLIDSARVVTLAERHEAALAHRRVYVEPVGDGMAWTHHLGPEIEAHAAYAKSDRDREDDPRARRRDPHLGSDPRGRDGRSADRRHHDGASPEARGIRATVVVTVPALALLEETDEAVAAAGADPATVEGIGPIPIGRARDLCGGDATWMRVLTHPETGMVLSVGRTQYSPPASLRRLVKWRADRCMGPGCGMPASRCEVDHTVAWEHGGDTALREPRARCARGTTRSSTTAAGI